MKEDPGKKQKFLSQISDLTEKAQSLKYPSLSRSVLDSKEKPDLQRILAALVKEREKKTSFELVHNPKAKELIQGNRVYNLKRRLERIKVAVSGLQTKHQSVSGFIEPMCNLVSILKKE